MADQYNKKHGRGRGRRKRQAEPQGDLASEYVWGVHPVEELVEASIEAIEAIWVVEGRAEELAEPIARARAHGITVQTSDRDELARQIPEASRGFTSGVVARLKPFQYSTLEKIIEGCDEAAVVVCLDGVQDVGNLGAILRSAAAFGVAGVVIPKDRAASVTGAVIRASAGQAVRVSVAQVTNMSRTIEQLAGAGFWSAAAMVGEDALAPWECDWSTGRVAIVCGGEHGGVRPLVARTCDWRVAIPMAEGVESLNVSVATATLLYEAMRQRRVQGVE